MFAEWNKDVLDSYLIEITSHILRFKDSDDQILLPKIRDVAGQVNSDYLIFLDFKIKTSVPKLQQTTKV